MGMFQIAFRRSWETSIRIAFIEGNDDAEAARIFRLREPQATDIVAKHLRGHLIAPMQMARFTLGSYGLLVRCYGPADAKSRLRKYLDLHPGMPRFEEWEAPWILGHVHEDVWVE